MTDESASSPKPPDELSKLFLSEYREITKHAKTEIAWVQSAYKLVASLITVIFLFVSYLSYKSVSDFMARNEQSIANRMDLVEKDMAARVQTSISSASTSVADRIDREFREESIHRLVEEKARIRVDQIADTLIDEKIQRAIEPKIQSADKQVLAVAEELKKAKSLVAALESTSEYMSTVVDAQSEDRAAFDRLRTMAENPSDPRREKAQMAWSKILDDHAQGFFTTGYQVPWKEGIDPSKLSLAELEKNFRQAPPHVRIGIIEYLSHRKDIPKVDRLTFYAGVIRSDSNLKVVQYASRYFNTEVELKFKPLAIREVLEWWEKNRESIKQEASNQAL